MRFPERRKRVMSRSMALGHCVCNPKQPCPCDIFQRENLCPCAGERPDPAEGTIRLTQTVRKAGCASKISQADLQRILGQLPTYDDPNVLIGMAAGDDAGIYRIEGEYNLVQTVDVFSPVVDDPYTYGQICAANSVSDVYAMGGRPICALSIIGFPIEELPGEVMTEILRGGIETMRDAGVSVIGGHSINDAELKCGFAVTGLIRGDGGITNAQAQVGDALVLTKPLGTGLISFGAQIGRVSQEAIELIGQSMATLNKDAAELMMEHDAHACTDVTGFSLLGHLTQMAKHSGVSAVICMEKIPVFAEALACARAGIIPGAVERNLESFGEDVYPKPETDESLYALLFDAQTSGGLLVVLPEERAEDYIAAMQARGHSATARIGHFTEKKDKWVHVDLAEPHTLVGTYRDGRMIIRPYDVNAPKMPEATQADVSGRMIIRPYDVEISKNQAATYECCPGGEVHAQPSPTADKTKSVPSMPSETGEAFKRFSQLSNAAGNIDARNKKLMAIALSIATKCEPCLKLHLQNAVAQGMPWADIEEAAWMAIFFCGAPAKMFYEKIKGEVVGA